MTLKKGPLLSENKSLFAENKKVYAPSYGRFRTVFGVLKNDGELILSEVKATPVNLLATGPLLLFATRPVLLL